MIVTSIQRISPDSYFNRDTGTLPQVALATGIPTTLSTPTPQTLYIPQSTSSVPDNLIVLGIIGIASMVAIVALAFAFANRKGE